MLDDPIFDSREPLPFETSAPGVFAVGDVRLGSMKRVAAAVGEGSSRDSRRPRVPLATTLRGLGVARVLLGVGSEAGTTEAGRA